MWECGECRESGWEFGGNAVGIQGIRLEMRGIWGQKKGFMNGNEIYKEWRGTKTKTNVFVYNYILRNFFTNQVVSHF